MDDGTRRCALPGCGALIQDIPGRPARRYCCAAHRASARQARRAALHPEQHARLVETLPWLREPEEERELVGAGAVAPATTAGAGVRPTSPPAPPVAPSSRPGRPDADPGAPVAHTDVERALRLPRLRRLSPHPDGAFSQRRRAIVVISAASILAGGFAIIAVPARESASSAVQDVASTEREWSLKAEITLTSLDAQLDQIAQAESAWNQDPTHLAEVVVPEPIRELYSRKQYLLQQQSALQFQFDSYHRLAAARAAVADAQRTLDDIDAKLAAAAPAHRRTPEEAATIATLQSQRDFQQQQLDHRRADLEGMESTVSAAVRTPLPDDSQKTTQVTQGVMDEIAHRAPTPPQTPAGPPATPEVIGTREERADPEKQETPTSAPPDPRGPREETAPRSSGGPVGAVAGAATDTVGGAVNEVGDALGGTSHGSSNHEDVPKDTPPKPDKGGVGSAVDGVGHTFTNTVADPGPAPVPAPAPIASAPAAASSGGASRSDLEKAAMIARMVPGGSAAMPGIEAAQQQASSSSSSSGSRTSVTDEGRPDTGSGGGGSDGDPGSDGGSSSGSGTDAGWSGGSGFPSSSDWTSSWANSG